MRGQLRACIAAATVAAVTTIGSAGHAAVVERFAVDQRGDVVLIGNTLAQNCADVVPAPVAGTLGNCGASSDDTGADVLWSVDAAQASASAGTGVTAAEAGSVAVLALPAGARVTHAELYWAAEAGPRAAGTATLSRAGAFTAAITATDTLTAGLDDVDFYRSVADVTALVQEHGAGAYGLGDIDAANPVGAEDTSFFAGWWLVVFYALDSEPVRHMSLHDGLELVTDGNPQSATLGGFEVPSGVIDAKLGVVAFEGDGTADGDQLRFGAAAPLVAADRVEASDNFFDGSRRGPSGAPLSVAGDLPRLSGAADSYSGMDLHVVDVAESLQVGQRSAVAQAFTAGDRFFLSGLVLSVATSVPDLTLSTESVTDLDGPPLLAGDELEYTVTVRNDGTGAAVDVGLREVLPVGVSFVPGSLEVVSGANPGLLTDAVDIDVGEVDSSAGETVIVRVGQGASALAGGRLAPGESSVVRYRVAVSAGATGTLQNQAQIAGTGEVGGVGVAALTDADPVAPGASATLVTVDACATDAECAATGGHCDVATSPRRCVECLEDAHCAGLLPTCDLSANACVCQSTATEEALCDGKDDDCDGVIDDGFAGDVCSVGEGLCAQSGVMVCDAGGNPVCGAVAGLPVAEVCDDGVDDDCDGQVDGLDLDCQNEGGGEGGPDTPAGVDVGAGLDPEATPGGDDAASEGSTPVRSGRPGASDGSGVRGNAPSGTAGASLGGGGGSCQLEPGMASARWSWLVIGAALAWRRRRARATPPA